MASAERTPGRARHRGIAVEIAAPLGLAALNRMVHEVARDDRLAALGVNGQAHVSRGMAGRGLEAQLLADPVIALDEIGAAGLDDGPHAVGNDRSVLVAVEL